MAKSKRARLRKREAHRQLQEKRRRQKRIIVIGSVVAVVLLVIGLVYITTRPDPGRAVPDPEPGRAVPDLGNAHIQSPQKAEYNSVPPTSGPHYEQLARWGIHTEPIPNELQVHNLEDGGVMVQYNCPEGCEDLIAQLANVVSRYNDHVILAPYPEMETRIALTAWEWIDTLEEFDEGRITRFIETYQGIDHHH